jgi:hypothetical protein
MADELDVYKDWLGIPEGPASLPITTPSSASFMFEDSADRIRANYKKLNAHVRKYASGKHSDPLPGAPQRTRQGDALP